MVGMGHNSQLISVYCCHAAPTYLVHFSKQLVKDLKVKLDVSE